MKMRGRGYAATAAQHLLVDHKLAVVLTDGTPKRLETGIGGIGRAGPLPQVATKAPLTNRRQIAAVQKIAEGEVGGVS